MAEVIWWWCREHAAPEEGPPRFECQRVGPLVSKKEAKRVGKVLYSIPQPMWLNHYERAILWVIINNGGELEAEEGLVNMLYELMVTSKGKWKPRQASFYNYLRWLKDLKLVEFPGHRKYATLKYVRLAKPVAEVRNLLRAGL